ncbi:hypothetical protein GF338_11330 [candidate division WOR-3 bacterium]|nr:hypothetical protein [candidate division WOR-3 bacterium]
MITLHRTITSILIGISITFLKVSAEADDIGTAESDQSIIYEGIPDPATLEPEADVSRLEVDEEGLVNLTPTLKRLWASSTLSPSSAADYEVTNLIDGNPATVWCEGAEGDGTSETVTITFSRHVRVTRFGIIPGYDKGDCWSKNLRIKKASLIFYSDKTSLTYGEDITCEDSRKMQYFDMNQEFYDDWSIELRFSSVYSEGAIYEDLCVAEIEIWGEVLE